MNPEDDTISITLGDTIYTTDQDFVLTGADDAYTFIDNPDTFTSTTTAFGHNFDWMTLDELNDNPSIKLGKHEITEDTVEKLQALLDMIDSLEDDNDLKALFNTQLAFNKIRGEK